MLHRRGFTLIEIAIAIAIVAVLASFALSRYEGYVERARVAQAIIEIRAMNAKLRQHMQDTLTPPDSLAVIGDAGRRDPWGRPYAYLNITQPGAIGKARKNKNLVPINTDFDLYSRGKDGVSVGPLTAGPSRDDVILASDGKFVGLASEYE